MRFALILTALLGGTAWAEPFDVIILGGGREEEIAEKAIESFKLTDGAKFTPADGFPKILDSGDIPGAPEDTYFAILGFCDQKKHSGVARRAILAIKTGAYTIALKSAGKHGDTCPKLAPELQDPRTAPKPKAKPKRKSG